MSWKLTLGAAAWSAVAGCAEAPETDPALEARAGQPLASAAVDPATRHALPSQQAIAVYWRAASVASASSLPARVRNATDMTKSVSLQLVGIDPYGRSVTRPIGKRSIGPKATLDFDVKIGELPVQSAGLASQLVLSASYEHELPTPGGAIQKVPHQVHSGAVYVTFTDGFAQAAMRSVGEQAALNGAQTRAGIRTALRLRHFNPSTNGVEEQSTAASALTAPSDSAPLPLISVTDVAIGPLPSTN